MNLTTSPLHTDLKGKRRIINMTKYFFYHHNINIKYLLILLKIKFRQETKFSTFSGVYDNMKLLSDLEIN